jgi:hypothetical protein
MRSRPRHNATQRRSAVSVGTLRCMGHENALSASGMPLAWRDCSAGSESVRGIAGRFHCGKTEMGYCCGSYRLKFLDSLLACLAASEDDAPSSQPDKADAE